MDKPMTAEEAARQLRQPQGEDGIKMGEKMNRSNKLLYDMTLDFMPLHAGDRILEIGMGNGHFISELFQRQAALHYTGLDMSDVMVQEAIKENEDGIKAGKVEIICGTAEEMTFPPGAFTKVFGVNVLYFWDAPDIALKAIHRVLAPGGQLILSFRSKETMEQLPFVDQGFTLYDIPSAKSLVEKNGFIVSEINTAVEPQKLAADGSKLVQLENICMRGIKN
ncbi:MAG TPA: class I SAM-dependent methyltransferase [Chitinophaga sp.]|nr:class I SAM-dependent methyltransferase [Chitinophaga sp.]